MTDFISIFQSFAKKQVLRPDPMQDRMVSLLNDIYEIFENHKKTIWPFRRKQVKGLYVYGGVGRGKTMVMDLFFESLSIKEKRRVHFNIFMLDVHNSVKILREDGRGKDPLQSIARDIAAKTTLLCFDEFQVYDIADAMVLSELFSELFKQGVTVIATSNVAPEDLYKDGLQRSRFLPFIDILKKNMAVFHMDSDTDYRQQALQESGVYFIQNEKGMNDLFQKFTASHPPKRQEIKVKGRKLLIERSVDDVAWVSFPELCEKPRGTSDYAMLSENYETIFLNNVPRMGYDRRNECKRFILLIDTLYDAHKHLVLNAEDVPEKLYNGKDHAFEFERTISRLLEMQGREYLSKIDNK